MDSRFSWALVALLLVPFAASAEPRSKPGKEKPLPGNMDGTPVGEGDPALLAVMRDLNEGLRAEWMDLRAQQIELLSIQQARAGGRIQPRAFRWVPNDPRRAGNPGVLTYLIDASEAAPAVGVTPEQADAAITGATDGWGSVSCVPSSLERRPDPGDDPDLFDAVFGFGTLGSYPAADVVFGGFLPASFFDLVTPSGGTDVIAFAVTFVFVDHQGQPTDLDADGYLDAAVSEIYFNAGFTWSTEGAAGAIDLETVALHELGHALGVGHVEPPPAAVMNPVYDGIHRKLLPLDLANACAVRY